MSASDLTLLRRVFAAGVEHGRAKPAWRLQRPEHVDEAFEHYRAQDWQLQESENLPPEEPCRKP